MPLRSGRVSYCRCFVDGDAPTHADATLLSILTEGAFAPAAVGAPADVEAGWITGEHLLDTAFEPAVNCFGDMLLFALRIDTHKPPADIKRACQRVHEQAILARRSNPTGMLSRQEKREASELAERELRDKAAAGQFRRSKSIDVLWDLKRKTIAITSASANVLEMFQSRFEQCFSVELELMTAGTLAHRLMKQRGSGRDFEDLRPSALGSPPASGDADADGEGHDSPRRASIPPVPWTMSGVDTKSFLGNEMAIWMWWLSETQQGSVDVTLPEAAKPQQLAFMIDKALDMDCAWGQRGKLALRADGPTRLVEAGEALAAGKWPRKLGLMLADPLDGAAFELALQFDRLQVGSALLPPVEQAPSARELLEQRLASFRKLNDLLDGLSQAFLNVRTSSLWQTRRQTLRQWITQRRPRV